MDADCCGLCFCCFAIAAICGRGCLYLPGCRDRRQAAEDEEYAAQVEEAQLYNNTGPGVSHPMPVITGNQNAQTDVPQGQDHANMIRDLRQDGPDVHRTKNYAERHAN